MTILNIKKRSGDSVPFKRNKISTALYKAFTSQHLEKPDTVESITSKVVDVLTAKSETASVEEVQNMVERLLMEEGEYAIAKAYMLYREQHAIMRRMAQDPLAIMDKYISNTDWQVRENSNMAYSLQGLNNHIASAVSKNYWLEHVYPKEVRAAHDAGDFHIHDLNTLSVYCVGWDLFDLLKRGFTGVPGKISSAPAAHLRSALGQIINFFYTLQGEAAGAQAFSNLDTLLAPFIRYDNLSYKELQQELQSFIFNLNVPTRVGFQTPFTNVTLDLLVPEHFRGMPVLRGGKPQAETYGEFQEEVNMFNKAFLSVLSEGDASGRVFTFPIPTYNITKDFDWDNPTLEGLWETTAKYGLPYFSNFVNSDMDPSDARSMCCRLRIDNRQLERRGGGLFGAHPLTGSIGVVTINLPRIALLAKDENDFLVRLGDLMNIAKESLEIKRKMIEKLTEDNLYPYTRFYLDEMKKTNGSYWKNHFSTIGLVGMNEATLNLLDASIADESGKAFAERVLDFMRERLSDYQEETGNNYNLEATPAESTAYRLALSDQKDFPNARFANGTGKSVKAPFYTNSTHLPVNYTDDILEILDLQDTLQTKYTGGTVIHFFIGERVRDANAVKEMVRIICEKYKLPYFTITPTFSVCSTHGYLHGEQPACPECGGVCEVYSRIVGYLRPIQQWNNGKLAEFKMRSTVPEQRVGTTTKDKTDVCA
ncbi:MAG TPA: ribonucleoside triphosphate reductase [Candidatus Kaiserbacteria bacterium]|nr:ribonucleoside triphosphate reductase [Candidatus Kaiserbacteria bacterium]